MLTSKKKTAFSYSHPFGSDPSGTLVLRHCWDLLSNTVLYIHMGILQRDILIRKQMKITSFTTMFTNMKVHISHCRSVL